MQTSIRLLSLFRARMGARRAAAIMAVAAVAMMPLASGCTRPQADNASSFLIITSVNAASGADPAQLAGVLSSDVITCVKAEGAPGDAFCPAEFQATIFGDPAQVKFALGMKDPSITQPTSANFITVNRYRVDFARSDGGSGVPASFESAFTVTVTGGDAQGGFLLVPVSAKAASPLSPLVFGGEIKTIATITFFGVDQAGRAVQASATIGVNFANYGDPG
jgi:hypothetical protein